MKTPKPTWRVSGSLINRIAKVYPGCYCCSVLFTEVMQIAHPRLEQPDSSPGTYTFLGSSEALYSRAALAWVAFRFKGLRFR